MINVNGTINVRQIVNQPGSTYNGRLQEKYNVVFKGWLARYGNGELHLLLNLNKELSFFRSNMDGLFDFWCYEGGFAYDIELDKKLFQDVKWEDDYPTEVQLKIM